MKIDAPAPPPAPVIPPDPQLEEIKKQAEEDKKNALQQRAGSRTQDLLLRFGARNAFTGVGLTPLTF